MRSPFLLFAFILCFSTIQTARAQVSTAPPPLPARAMAEWEELQALAISWTGQSNILTEIVRAARTECRVLVCCNTPQVVTQARNKLLQSNVDTSNVSFIVAPTNTIWMRDYGPNCIYLNDVDSLGIVDWLYNRKDRSNDDQLPEKLGQYLHLPVYSTSVAPYDLVHTGGNFMADGMGTGFSSRLLLNNNDQIKNGDFYNFDDVIGTSDHDETAIDNIMQEYMGIDRNIKFDTLPYDRIHHVDMHLKLLDEETLLVGRYPQGIADGPQIEANIQYLLSHYQSAFGTPYRIKRLLMPPHNGLYPNTPAADYRTYVNAVVVNKTVIVPFYETQYDTIAQRLWAQMMPGYRIVGVNCNGIIPYDGAIHCITKEIGVADPLRLVHQPVREVFQSASTPSAYPLQVLAEHRSGIAAVKAHFRRKNVSNWSVIDLSPVALPDSANYWQGAIPRQEGYYDTIYYYIDAVAHSGKTMQRPMPGPEGPWAFRINEISGVASEGADLEEIYPNPASGITVVPVRSNASVKSSVWLYNSLQQPLIELFNGTVPAGDSNYFFDAGQWPSGIYYVVLRTENAGYARKVIIK